MRAIRSQSLKVSKFSDTRIEGSVNVKTDGIFMLTVPFDTGWKVLVDGQAVETKALDGCFISFNITAGIMRSKCSTHHPGCWSDCWSVWVHC
jgi:uncharacterized membrane protein YfhO